MFVLKPSGIKIFLIYKNINAVLKVLYNHTCFANRYIKKEIDQLPSDFLIVQKRKIFDTSKTENRPITYPLLLDYKWV